MAKATDDIPVASAPSKPKMTMTVKKSDLPDIEKYGIGSEVDFHVYGTVAGMNKVTEWKDGKEKDTNDIECKIEIEKLDSKPGETKKSKRIL